MSRRKKLVIFLVVIVCGLLIAAATYFLLPQFIHSPSAKLTKTSQAANGAYRTAVNKAYEQAVSVASQQGAAVGQSVLDKQLSKADSNQQKAMVYAAKSALATSPSGGSDYVNALQYTLQSNTLNPTYTSAEAVAFCYAQLRDKTNAIKYYQIAIDRIGDYTKADPMTQADYGYYQRSIQELQL